MRPRVTRQPWPLVLAALLCACGGDDGVSVDSGAADGGPVDAGGAGDAGPGLDSGDGLDAGPGVDGGPARDAGPTVDGGGSADGGVPDAWEAWCTDGGPARASGCGDTFDTAGCLALGECIVSRFVPSTIDPLVECLGDRACHEGDDACFSFEGLGLTPSEDYEQWQADCIEKRITCPPAMRWSDDLCFPGLVTDAVIGELSACLDMACGDVGDCILGTFGCD